MLKTNLYNLSTDYSNTLQTENLCSIPFNNNHISEVDNNLNPIANNNCYEPVKVLNIDNQLINSLLLPTNTNNINLYAPLSISLDNVIPSTEEYTEFTINKYLDSFNLLNKIDTIKQEQPFGPSFFLNTDLTIQQPIQQPIETETVMEKFENYNLKTLVQSVRDTINTAINLFHNKNREKVDVVINNTAKRVEEAFSNNYGKNIVLEDVEQVLYNEIKTNIDLPENTVNEIAHNLALLTMHNQQKRIGPSQHEANMYVNTNEIQNKIGNIIGKLSHILNETTTLTFDPNYGVIVDAINMKKIEEATKQIIKDELLPYAMLKVNIMKDNKKLDENTYYSCVNLSNSTNILKEMAEEIANDVYDGVVEKFISKLPENFTEKGSHHKYAGNDGIIKFSHAKKKVNMRELIKHTTKENFADLSYQMEIMNLNDISEVNGIVSNIITGTSNIDFDAVNIIALDSSTELTKDGKVVTMNLTSSCPFDKKDILTSSLSSVISNNLLNEQIKKVEVISTKSDDKNTNVTVKATVPTDIDTETVFEKITESFNATSYAVMNNSVIGNFFTNKNIFYILCIIIIIYILKKRN